VKTLTRMLAALATVGLLTGPAFAFSCPSLVKGANEAIAKAEATAAKTTDDRQKARNAGLIDEAKELNKGAEAAHASAAHGRAEAKAHAAKALAEMVK
jgi:hypothetical protein